MYQYFLPLLLLFSFTSSSCFFPNSSQSTRDFPCITEGQSWCCGIGWACLSNQMCEDGTGSGRYARGTCTDSTWTNSACPHFCNNPDANDLVGGGELMARCPSETNKFYCNNTVYATNCTTNQNVIYFQGTISTISIILLNAVSSTSIRATISTSSLIISTTSQVSSSSTATSSTVSSSPTTTSESTSHTAAAAIGAGIGSSLGVLAICLGAFFWYYQRRSRKAYAQPSDLDMPSPPQDFKHSAQEPHMRQSEHYDGIELHSRWSGNELYTPPADNADRPHELYTDGST